MLDNICKAVACLFSMVFLILSLPALSAEKQPAYGTDIINGTELKIPADLMVRINSYDSASRTYNVSNADLPGEGEFFVALEVLSKSVEALELEKLMIRPKSVVGYQYKVKKAMPTFASVEVKKRAQHFSERKGKRKKQRTKRRQKANY